MALSLAVADASSPKVKLYNWNDLAKESPRAGIEGVAFRGDNAMVVLNWIRPGMEPEPHSHPFEQLVLIVQGRTRLHVGDEVPLRGAGRRRRLPQPGCFRARTPRLSPSGGVPGRRD